MYSYVQIIITGTKLITILASESVYTYTHAIMLPWLLANNFVGDFMNRILSKWLSKLL